MDIRLVATNYIYHQLCPFLSSSNLTRSSSEFMFLMKDKIILLWDSILIYLAMLLTLCRGSRISFKSFPSQSRTISSNQTTFTTVRHRSPSNCARSSNLLHLLNVYYTHLVTMLISRLASFHRNFRVTRLYRYCIKDY